MSELPVMFQNLDEEESISQNGIILRTDLHAECCKLASVGSIDV